MVLFQVELKLRLSPVLTRTASQIQDYLRSLNVPSFIAVNYLLLEIQGNQKEENNCNC